MADIAIPFTEYVLPNGRKAQIEITRPAEIGVRARSIIAAGYRFEIETLTTGKVSLTIVDADPEADDPDVAIELCAKEDVGPAVDRLVSRFTIPAADEPEGLLTLGSQELVEKLLDTLNAGMEKLEGEGVVDAAQRRVIAAASMFVTLVVVLGDWPAGLRQKYARQLAESLPELVEGRASFAGTDEPDATEPESPDARP